LYTYLDRSAMLEVGARESATAVQYRQMLVVGVLVLCAGLGSGWVASVHSEGRPSPYPKELCAACMHAHKRTSTRQ
jgi:hypothetical protein